MRKDPWRNKGVRDPKRIERILTKLRRAWHMHPDLRLGQLIVNVTGKSDPFYVEDDKTEQLLSEWLEQGGTDGSE